MRANDDDPNWWRRERDAAAVVCTPPPVWILALAVLFALGVRAWAAWLSEAYTRLTGTTPTNAIAPSAPDAGDAAARTAATQKIDAILATGTDEPPFDAARLGGLRYLDHDISACCDGLGATFNFLRASVFYVLAYNLTWVPHTLCATHGVNKSAIANWLDLGHGEPCDARCVARGVAARALRPVDAELRGGKQTLESRLAAGKDALGATIGATPAAGTVFRVRGCPKFTLVMPEMRAWFRTKYEGRRHRTALEYAPRKTIVAMHFRAGGIVGSHMFRGRWIEPEWYIATVRRILSVSSLDATAATGDTELWLFSEGRADEPHFVTLRNGFAGLDLKVRLGSGDDVPRDVDHMAAAHVLVAAHSSFSLLAATYSDGVKLIQPLKHKHLRHSPGITRKLHVDSGGEFDADDFLELCAEATAKVRADRCRRGRRRG